MHLWNIKILAKKLGQDNLSERTGMHYYLVASLLILFDLYYSLWLNLIDRGWVLYFEFGILSVITVFGCLEAFKSNGSNEGRDFVKRAICLSVPVGVRVTVFSIFFTFCLYLTASHVYSFASFRDPQRVYTIVSYTGFVGFNVYFWWLLVKSLKQVQQYEKST